VTSWQLRIASNAAASAWDDRTSIIDRETLRITGQAFDGQIGQGGFDLADDAGNVSIPGYRVFDFKLGSLVLERGRVAIKDRARGTRWQGDAHQKAVTLIDCNADLSRIGVHGWSRPAETGYARVLGLVAAFLNGSPRASTVIGTSLVRNANTVLMPKKRYDNANPHEVLQDCADTEAKIFFVTVTDAGAMVLFYDVSTYTGYASGLSITDAAPNLTTQFPPIEPTSSEDPEELFSKVRMTYPGGSVTATDAAVAAAHDYLETIYHDEAATASTAQSRANRFLGIHKEEEVGRRCSIQVPEASLNQIRRGQTISYRAAATGDLTPITRRIAQLTWQPPEVEGGFWTAILELDWPLKVGQRYTRPKPPPASPLPYVCEAIDFTVPEALGGDLACVLGMANNCITTDYVQLYGQCMYRVQWTVYHGASPLTGGLVASVITRPGGVQVVAHYMGASDDGDAIIFAEDFFLTGEAQGTTGDYQVALFHNGDTATGADCSVVGTVTYVSGQDPRFTSLVPCDPPVYGQPVNNESVAGGSGPVGIVSSSVANPTVITTGAAHGLTSGDKAYITGHTSVTPAIDGTHVVTVLTDTTFTIPVNVTDGGVGGTVSKVFTTNHPYLPGSLRIIIPVGVMSTPNSGTSHSRSTPPARSWCSATPRPGSTRPGRPIRPRARSTARPCRL